MFYLWYDRRALSVRADSHMLTTALGEGCFNERGIPGFDGWEWSNDLNSKLFTVGGATRSEVDNAEYMFAQ